MERILARPTLRSALCRELFFVKRNVVDSRTKSDRIQPFTFAIPSRSKVSLAIQQDSKQESRLRSSQISQNPASDPRESRLPRSVQALYLQPLRRHAEHGIPTCDLQIRSYSLQPLQFFADFALRAAYYLGLPAYGPVPLPRITERWTVPRDHFIFKKSQENFERRTLRRLIQIRDGQTEAMELWLAYLRKYQIAGVGMKANMWEFGEVGARKDMEITDQQSADLDQQFAHLAQLQSIGSPEDVEVLLSSRRAKEAAGLRQLPTTASPSKVQLKCLAARTVSILRFAILSIEEPRYMHSEFWKLGLLGATITSYLDAYFDSLSSHESFELYGNMSISKAAARAASPRTIFSGIQPTGIPHLGNYAGALKQWVQLQYTEASSTKLLYSIVDLHALTSLRSPTELHRSRRETLAALIAIGIKPERATIFHQSSIPEHSELMWILSCSAPVGYLSRMTQWKQKLKVPDDFDISSYGPQRQQLQLGLFSYPVLQAADVLVHSLEPLMFQSDTIKLSISSLLGNVPPDSIRLILNVLSSHRLSSTHRIKSLLDPQSKMSKSDCNEKSRILVTDTSEQIHSKIMQARTDSCHGPITFDPVQRPGVANLLAMLSIFDTENRSPEALATTYETASLKQLKQAVAYSLAEGLAGVGDEYLRLLQTGGDYLDQVEAQGMMNARESASATMSIVRQAIGLPSLKQV